MRGIRKDERMSDQVCLNLGCWHRHIPGWVHVDLCDMPHIDHKTSIDKLPMFEDGSVDLIYSSHSFPYFDRQEAVGVLAEWHRVLKPGGTLRLAVTDFDALLKVYAKTGELPRILGPLFGRMEIETPDGPANIYEKTTYNEVDMSAVMDLRNEYKDLFLKKHGVKLGFMSFFVKACCHALNEVPEVNAEIDGTDVVYKNFVHMGVAVGTPNGLVVPVVRDADQMSFHKIEQKISELGLRARDGKLSMAEMQGGTFTISNGGVYGSLMSSPILNPPQSGILGMHKIQDRPVAINGEVVIRPMMYLALSYDHRIVDGKGAVTFLVRVKEALEDPRRLLMDL